MTFLDKLKERSPGEALLFLPDCKFTVRDFFLCAHALRENHSRLEGKPVVLRVRERTALPFYLAAFDGHASRMAIILETFADTPAIVKALEGYATVSVDAVPEIPVESISCQNDATTLATKWMIPTSGTTGTPKIIEHDFAGLISRLKCDPGRGKAIRWAMFYDVARFAGLQVMLQVVVGGSSLVWTEGMTVGEAVSYMLAQGVNAVSATPTMYRKLLMKEQFTDLNPRYLTLGGEIADQQILDALSHSFPEARITHIYASTEAGVGFSVVDGLAGFPSAWLETGLPRGGRIKIDGDRLYLCRDDHGEANWIDTEDIVEVSADRCYFRGRRSGAINVGGNKVMPDEVEAVLLAHDAVSLTRVMAKKSSFVGNLVVAEVVLREPLKIATDNKEMSDALIAHAARSLESFKVPATIKFVDNLEVSDAGKIRRD